MDFVVKGCICLLLGSTIFFRLFC